MMKQLMKYFKMKNKIVIKLTILIYLKKNK